MDSKQLTGVVMKHEGRLGKLEQQAHTLEVFCSKHANQHFQLRLFSIAQLVILIGLVVGLVIGLT